MTPGRFIHVYDAVWVQYKTDGQLAIKTGWRTSSSRRYPAAKCVLQPSLTGDAPSFRINNNSYRWESVPLTWKQADASSFTSR